jgi:DNA-binding NarL/FixJ family response regulator
MRKCTANGNPIQLLVAETCRLSCELMAMALCHYRRHLSVVACATDSAQILKAFVAKRPDVCIISSRLKDGNTSGINVVRQLHAAHEGARVLMLIDSLERGSVIEAFRSGALGVFPRDGAFDELYQGIQKISTGQVWANNEQLQYLVESIADGGPPAITDARGNTLLTRREQSLVDLVSQGRTNRDISRELNLSEHTVRNYLFRIFNKLGTSNRLELALYAISHRESGKEPLVAQARMHSGAFLGEPLDDNSLEAIAKPSVRRS